MAIDQFQTKLLGKEDTSLFKKLISMLHEVFEMNEASLPDETYLQTLLERQDFIALVVVHKDEIIGGLTAHVLPMYYSKDSEVFIYDVGVKAEFQRKGIGHLMISSLKDYCKQNGIKDFFVAAHEEDKHALDFYQSTGGKAEKVVHFNYPLK
jgi:aminoglycoside 3-N-acetyltransferase I